jgi:hypothetical protein
VDYALRCGLRTEMRSYGWGLRGVDVACPAFRSLWAPADTTWICG